MAGSNFADEVRAVLSDTLNLPADFLDYVGVQFPAQNILPVAKTSGERVAISTRNSNVTTTGTTFAAGTDLLASPIEFTATGSNSYILRVSAPEWFLSTSGNIFLRLNLDGADGTVMASSSTGMNATSCNGAAYIATPSSGEHSVNVRLVVSTGTGTVAGAAASSVLPIIVTLEVA